MIFQCSHNTLHTVVYIFPETSPVYKPDILADRTQCMILTSVVQSHELCLIARACALQHAIIVKLTIARQRYQY